MTSVMVNFNTEKTNVILGKKSEVLWGQPYIEDFIGDVKYQISPQSFFQVNPMQTEKLYAKALEYAGLNGVVFVMRYRNDFVIPCKKCAQGIRRGNRAAGN